MAANYARAEPQWLVRAHRAVAAALVHGLDIGPADVVLDLAAGTGTAARLAAARGAGVVAVDVSPAQVRAGLAGGGGIGWAVADIEALPFTSGSFGRIVSNLGLIYAASPRLALRELRRVLGPAGRAAFSAHAPDAFGPAAAALVNGYLFAALPSPVEVTRWGAPPTLREWLAGWPCELVVRPFAGYEQHESVEAFWAFSVARRRHVRHLARTLESGRLAAFRREYCELARQHTEPAAAGFRLRHAYRLVTLVPYR